MSEPTLSEIRDDLVKAVERTLRIAGLTNDPQPALPLPSDPEAEKSVIGAVLCGEIGIVELGDLEAGHFFLGLHRWLFEKAQASQLGGVELSAPLLVAKANSEGIPGEALIEDIEDLMSRPFEHPDFVRQHAARIRQFAEARELIKKLQRVELALRSSVRTPAQAIKYLHSLEAL